MTGTVAGITLVALHAVGGVLTLTLTTIAPWWVVLLLAGLWGAIGRAAWRRRRTAPLVTMLAPLLYSALVLLTLAGGLRGTNGGT